MRAVFVIVVGLLALAPAMGYAQQPTWREGKAEQLSLARERAVAGDVAAMEEVGRLLISGHGIQRDQAQGVTWILRAAETRPELYLYLGNEYLSGQYLDKSYENALQAYEKAAGHNIKLAHWALGNLYSAGKGTAVNPIKAAQHYAAVEQAGGFTTLQIAWNYAYGSGVEEDDVKAVELMRQAADAGDAQAMYELSAAYEFGEGVPMDPVMDLYWLTRAADLGLPAALDMLADRYESGQGVTADAQKAAELRARARATP
ncbi:hypothetical protein ABAC460_05835 [Asticcacaulis sp. AC460]|uniref:tetratricopeptide repeat protein n=1 Tax=Asticcacaulis sp. AC460 TaxID=1282360 RepID=UPI0003C3C527|nr:tetratricopeptide repeat protein [Asticcacaulis sp. AC460]ESQ91503.1 hypothetical protein ABAC460_05835 [Asticcacaulis sp. AC460]